MQGTKRKKRMKISHEGFCASNPPECETSFSFFFKPYKNPPHKRERTAGNPAALLKEEFYEKISKIRNWLLSDKLSGLFASVQLMTLV